MAIDQTPDTARDEAEAAERRKVLHRLWQSTVKALAEAVEKPGESNVPAATLQSARQFLRDNGIEIDSLDREASLARRRPIERQVMPFRVPQGDDDASM